MPLDTIPVARTELIALSEAVAAATLERDRAQAAYDALAPAADRLEMLVAEHRIQLQAMVNSSIEAGRYTDHLFLANELSKEIAEQQPLVNLDAVRSAKAELDDRNVVLGQLKARHQTAVYGAALEVVRAHLRDHCIPAMAESLRQLAAAESVSAALRQGGVTNAEAISCAHQIDAAIFETRRSLAVRGDLTAGAAFLNELANNPGAELPVPEVTVERVEAPVMRPLEDGSQFINRGEPEVEPEIGVSTPFYRTGWEAALSAQDEQNSEPAATTSEPEPANSGISSLPWEAVPGPTFGPPPPAVPEWLQSSSPAFMAPPRPR